MDRRQKILGAVFGTSLLLACATTVAPPDPTREKVYSLLEKEGKKLGALGCREITETVMELSQTYHLDPMLILAVIHVESRFDPKAVSHRDARGLMQVRPIVVREVARDLGIPPGESHKLLTSHPFNVKVGVHYLATLIHRFRGDVLKALMAYNMGPTAVARLYKNRPVPAGGYQGKVLRVFAAYTGS